MSKRHQLQFNCQSCQQPVSFSLFELEHSDTLIACQGCGKKYAFNDADLIRQMKKFADLCRQLQESEEILSNTAVGIDVGEHHVKVPYKILLTRLNSVLDLMVGNKPLSITFRFEPILDTPSILEKHQ